MDLDAELEEGVALPCHQALLGATLALMTAYAQPSADARVDAATQRRLMARRIVSNLFFLREHPALAPGLRQVMTAVHGHWAALARSLEAAAAFDGTAAAAAAAAPGGLH